LDHRAVLLSCASITIAGVESAHRIRKGQFSFARGRRYRSRKDPLAVTLARM
jgi:hypothetical protein